MDFGVVTLEGLVVGDASAASTADNKTCSSSLSSLTTVKPKGNHGGSGFLKRSGPAAEDNNISNSKRSKTPKTEAMLHQQGIPLLRSTSVFSDDDSHNMLSFSSANKNGGLGDRNPQNPTFLLYGHTPAPTRNAGYGSAGLSAGMRGAFARYKGPFSPSQWMELEHQALIYKHFVSDVPVPPNLLIPLRKAISPFSLYGSSSGSYSPNSFGWGSFHLFSGNTDAEPGRCRRTDGKKWRCSRDAVPDQKYCERHINRGRHRSRKPVEGQNGHAVSGSTTNPKVVTIASSPSTSVMSSSGATISIGATHHQFKSLQPCTAEPSADTAVNRMQEPQNLSRISSTINLRYKDPPFSLPQHVPFEDSSQSGFGLVSSDSLLYPQKSSYMNLSDCNAYLGFGDQERIDQPLRHFIDDWPKNLSDSTTVAWPEELKSDWTQLSMSIPMAPLDFSSSSNSPRQEKLMLSPLSLSREFDPAQMGLGVSRNSDLGEPTQKQTNWIPISWGNSMGGPLGEVLNSTSSSGGVNKMDSSALNLMTEVWDGSPQLGSSPTGVLQKATHVSLSNSSSGSSPRAENKTALESGSLRNDLLGSTLASSSTIPSMQV